MRQSFNIIHYIHLNFPELVLYAIALIVHSNATAVPTAMFKITSSQKDSEDDGSRPADLDFMISTRFSKNLGPDG